MSIDLTTNFGMLGHLTLGLSAHAPLHRAPNRCIWAVALHGPLHLLSSKHLHGTFKPKPLNTYRPCLWCRGWCELLCGRGCGFCAGPFKRYQEAFSAGRYMPTLQVSNYMNQEAIVQVVLPCAHILLAYAAT